MQSGSRNKKLYDLAAASPLIVWYGYAIAHMLPQIVAQIASAPRSFQTILPAASQIVTIVFLGLQITLFLIRRVPMSKAEGWMPRAAALVGSNLLLALLAIPRVTLSPTMTIFSSLFVLAGTAGAIWSAMWLGRSFAIFPQARALVTGGPYRFVRHPIYLAEQIAAFGILWQYQQPWALLIVLANLAAQFPRMYFEEQVLTKNFPFYSAYAACTARLVPGVY
ncbi:MAG TPA: isoprenylcysteine carboxylmethyltransferase family protein [Rhizomicrobium sp.]